MNEERFPPNADVMDVTPYTSVLRKEEIQQILNACVHAVLTSPISADKIPAYLQACERAANRGIDPFKMGLIVAPLGETE